MSTIVFFYRHVVVFLLLALCVGTLHAAIVHGHVVGQGLVEEDGQFFWGEYDPNTGERVNRFAATEFPFDQTSVFSGVAFANFQRVLEDFTSAGVDYRLVTRDALLGQAFAHLNSEGATVEFTLTEADLLPDTRHIAVAEPDQETAGVWHYAVTDLALAKAQILLHQFPMNPQTTDVSANHRSILLNRSTGAMRGSANTLSPLSGLVNGKDYSNLDSYQARQQLGNSLK